MARRDSRSPSPAGSYSSKRSKRDDDRHVRDKRDEPRNARRRSRSPGFDRRHRDRDYQRDFDRRNDRRDDDYYRSGRRDRSRERYRSPDRLGRERRDRSRDRDNRNRRDDSRERLKRRRDDSTDSKNKRKREDSRDGRNHKTAETHSRDVRLPNLDPRSNPSNSTDQTSKPATPTVLSEEDKKAERLAKLEAWKQKQAAEREKKQKELDASGGTRNLLNEMDKKAAEASASASPRSPATPQTPLSPAPYAGKFDPKNIAKKAAANATAAGALGADVPLPKNAKASATLDSPLAGMQANQTKATSNQNITNQSNASALKASGNVGGFGLALKAQAEVDKGGNKPGIDFGEEESIRKKLEKLPTPPPDALSNDDTALPNGDVGEEEDEDDDIAMENADTEEEAAAAARAAAEKREERLLAQSNVESNKENGLPEASEGNEDVEMTNDADSNDLQANGEGDGEAEEELDPLDAFMSGLDAKSSKAPGLGGPKSKSKKQEPDVFENEDNELDAMDINADDFLGEAASKIRKKKDIPTINHAKMNYEPFRRNFYSEPSELSELTEQEVADLRLELDGIKVRGVDVPKPVQKWSQCGLGAASLEVVRKMGFEAPTSIQSQALPAIMSGRDVIGIAKTGSGKTIAFLLPMFRHIKDQRSLDALDGPVGLVMTPTRELATQIHKECKPWLKALNLRAVCAYGGAPIKDQIADLKRGAEIIVCTPGRMIDLLAANSGRVTNLRRVTYTVLDEADRMFDMGFEPQVMKILANIRPQRQTVLFSATFPRNMEALARKTLTKPVEIIVGGRSVVAPEIKQIVEVRPENTKFLRLLQLLGDTHEDEDARSLIFVDRQESAEELMNAILRKGYPCFTIHGGKDQYDRDSVISDFKAGIFPVLVATSVAARGLDVKQLKMVVNFDCPNHLEDYVHRAGRTGRAGNTGLAVTFITEEQDRYAIDVAKALRQSGQEIPEALQKLVDSFTEKVKAGKEKASAQGFGGKGLERLDQERDAAKARERKTYRTGDEPDDEDKEKEEDTSEAAKADEEAIIVKATSSTTAAPTLPALPDGIDLDGKVTVHKREETDANGAGGAVPADKTQRVHDAVAAINARLRKGGELRGNAPIDNKGPDAGAFHSTFEINDLPQKARWAVTNRTNVAKILEATGTSITTKGNFYPQGQVPGPTDMPKLYILVEGDTEVVVTQAVSELRRLAKDGMVAALNSEARAPASGRYSVV